MVDDVSIPRGEVAIIYRIRRDPTTLQSIITRDLLYLSRREAILFNILRPLPRQVAIITDFLHSLT